MNTNIQIFNNPNFGEIRIVEVDGKIMFAASEIATCLGYENPSKAIIDHCKSGNITKWYIAHDNGIGGVYVNFIPESEVYRLIIHSKLKEAEKFQDWVFDEVLPSIRKHGGYLTPQKIEEALLNPDTLILLATNLKDERQKRLEAEQRQTELQAANEAMKPKALFADAVATSQRSILVSELAKILKQNGIEIGQNRLFSWLRDNGYLCSKGEYYNRPTQKAMEMGLFEIKKTSINKPDGSVLVTCTTKVSGKGQIYFVNKFIKGREVA
ncbi:MAG: phage antirepressor KilAC domain-containing protein [Prevotellaceae bacterium]|jgi:anti-repressor protein|nr:phage antirepressor KilAC domain-containing protein [Prevotellaceae bacterium]